MLFRSQQGGLDIPILIGGATTSAEHTARHLAPHYAAPVLWTSDASQLVILAKKLYALDAGKRMYSPIVKQLQTEQEALRTAVSDASSLHSLDASRKRAATLYE